MPLTFPAHQGLVLGAKLRWLRYIDGSALCIGAASPDLAYPLGGWLGSNSHSLLALLIWSIPITLVLTVLLRWRAAVGIFSHVPDCGPLRLRSFAVLGRPKPSAAKPSEAKPNRVLLAGSRTLASASLGAASHIVVDTFTHSGRWGSDWLELDRKLLSVPIRGDLSVARVLQYFGHAGGSVAFVIGLLLIARGQKLETWYGVDAVQAARLSHTSMEPTRFSTRIFWAIAVVPPVVALVVAYTFDLKIIFLPISVFVASLTIAGVLTATPRASDDRNAQTR